MNSTATRVFPVPATAFLHNSSFVLVTELMNQLELFLGKEIENGYS